MGCFSFLCVNSGKPALSTSFDGSPCKLFLMKEGRILEEMHGNYNSYGRVFNGKGGSFEWEMDWHDVCDLMFGDDPTSGIAMILDEYDTGELPSVASDSDPNQGWGSGDEDEDLMGDTLRGDPSGDCSDDMFPRVENPYHRIHGGDASYQFYGTADEIRQKLGEIEVLTKN